MPLPTPENWLLDHMKAQASDATAVKRPARLPQRTIKAQTGSERQANAVEANSHRTGNAIVDGALRFIGERQRTLTRPGYRMKPEDVADIAMNSMVPEAPSSPHAPNEALQSIARRYVEGSGVSPAALSRITAVDPEKGQMMAKAYSALKSDPSHPDVVKAYHTFGQEVSAQAKALGDAGYTRTMMDNDPYENSAAMLKDLRDNKHLRVFKTNAENPHPLLTNEQNDQFRWVHDVLGHGQHGNQFGPKGEEMAFRDHSAMFSPEARRVMATETRGQNSWVNFGDNAHLPMKDRPYAEQKAALWPEHLMGEYDGMAHIEAPAVHVDNGWKPVERGVFDRSVDPAGEYREPAPLGFDTGAGPKAEPSELSKTIGRSSRVEKRLRSDVEKGLNQGGRSWYGLKPLKDFIDGLGGPNSFSDFNMAGAAGSARTSTHNELTNASLLMYAKANGVTPEVARQEFLKRFPNSMRPTFMGMHGDLFARGQNAGLMIPAERGSGSLKIPSYYHDRMMGANGIALDTHEQRAMAQALGIPEDDVSKALGRNSLSYMQATRPYHRIAKDMGLHPDQVQASRWLGGGLQTGLDSQPTGDFLQTLEDGLLYTARSQGLGEAPHELRGLFGDIVNGKNFFMPYSRGGGFPVY